MEAEQQQLRGLYRALGSLEDHTTAAQRLDVYAVDPAPLYDASGLPVDRRRAPRVAAHLSSARAQADALARAEARLDGELVSRVFQLATKVLQANRDLADRRELASAMRAFGEAVAALRRQQEPPHGAGAIPRPHTTIGRSALSGLATKSEVDAGVAEAAALLEQVREIAVRQAREIAARIDAAEERSRALFGVVEAPEPPSRAGALQARAEALSTSGTAVQRADEIAAVRAGFDETMLGVTNGYNQLKERTIEVQGKLSAVEAAAGDITAG